MKELPIPLPALTAILERDDRERLRLFPHQGARAGTWLLSLRLFLMGRWQRRYWQANADRAALVDLIKHMSRPEALETMRFLVAHAEASLRAPGG